MVEQYIQQSRAYGMTDDQIRQALLRAGWQINAIEQALKPQPNSITQVSTPTAKASPSLSTRPKEKKRTNNIFLKWWFYLIVVIILVVSAGIYFVFTQGYVKIPKSSEEISGKENILLIADQEVAYKFQIQQLVLQEPGFLVIQPEDTAIVGLPLSYIFLASSNWLVPGTYDNFTLAMNDNLEIEKVAPGNTLVATLYKDSNNNGYYDLFIDTEPILNASGEKARITFVSK